MIFSFSVRKTEKEEKAQEELTGRNGKGWKVG